MEAVRAIYAHHVAHGLGSFEETAPDAAELMLRRAAVLRHGLPYLVAELDGRVAGFAYASPYRARTAYRHTVEDSIYVAPDAVRRGVARALLRALVTHCEAQGYRQMIAVIGGTDNLASITLHARVGFREAGMLRAVGFKFGHWVDSVLMQRALGPGADCPPDS
jgi:L-amino acid N-acyltransferase YncA